jgi:hypothetical protein
MYFPTILYILKFFARNRVCEIWWMAAHEWFYWICTLFAFAVSRTDFYSLAKRNVFSRSLIYLYCAYTILFRAKYFAFRREKAPVESGLNTAARRYDFYFRVVKTIFYARAQWLSKILFLTREDKSHIFKPPCNVLFII